MPIMTTPIIDANGTLLAKASSRFNPPTEAVIGVIVFVLDNDGGSAGSPGVVLLWLEHVDGVLIIVEDPSDISLWSSTLCWTAWASL